MARILSIDYGDARIGLAMTDPNKIMALPFKTVPSGKNALQNIKDALGNTLQEIERIVIGLPLHLNGNESPMSEKIRKFASVLQETLNIPVVLFDERMTSSYAECSLKEMHLNRKQRSQKVDTSAATIILQNYLDSIAISIQ